MSKAIVAAAARRARQRRPDGAELAQHGQGVRRRRGIELAQNCFQVFGGIGYTWEHDQHLYLRRLTTDAALFGGRVAPRAHAGSAPSGETDDRDRHDDRRRGVPRTGPGLDRGEPRRRDAGTPRALDPWDGADDDVEDIAGERALQRKLFDAGYAGIT